LLSRVFIIIHLFSFLLAANVTAKVCLPPFDLKNYDKGSSCPMGYNPTKAPLEDPPEG